MKNLILLLVCFCFSFTGWTQAEFNQWRFGYYAALDFNSGSPVSIAGSALSQTEGSTSLADASGNLLFYSNGVTVYNRLNMPMPNGFGLLGNSSSTQSGVAVKQPGFTDRYYIFTAPETGTTNPLCYNVIDMTADGGYGDVILKNVVINPRSCEKICAVRHCNNVDVWIITHDINTNGFRSFLLTAAGLNPLPVVSNSGPVVPNGTTERIGYLKSSPQGDRLVACYYGMNISGLFDFNNNTGVVSNYKALTTANSGPYGCEFSPDGKKVYVAFNTGSFLCQFDACATDPALTRVNVGVSIGLFTGALQRGPDGKIYLSRSNIGTLDVINSPNVAGLGCNFVQNAITLVTGTQARFGLPNHSDFYSRSYLPFTFNTVCNSTQFIFPTMLNSSCSTINPTSWIWNFGDNTTSTQANPVHTYALDGSYWVTLTLNFACYSATLSDLIVINTSIGGGTNTNQ
jgi:hypothetical protein